MNNGITSYIMRRINQILVHSYLYEQCTVNIIDDSTWDKWAKELVSLIHKYPDIAKKSPYYEQFKDWTGDTASTFIFDDTIANRARLCYFCHFGRKPSENN